MGVLHSAYFTSRPVPFPSALVLAQNCSYAVASYVSVLLIVDYGIVFLLFHWPNWNYQKIKVRSCDKVRKLFPKRKVRFARAKQQTTMPTATIWSKLRIPTPFVTVTIINMLQHGSLVSYASMGLTKLYITHNSGVDLS